MVQSDQHYSPDEGGVIVENVGPWAIDKLRIVTDYVQASGAARRRYLTVGAAYIDVFCGPGRSRIRTTGQFIDGSPVAAFKKARDSLAAFTSVNISDADPQGDEARLTRFLA
jgi:three-Cys-motif partner protein